MSNESHVEELIAWYVLGTLSPSERVTVEAHLATCAHCRGLVAEIEGAAQMLPQMIEPVTPSPQLKRRLMARVDADLASTQLRAAASDGLFDRLASLLRAWSPGFALASLVLVLVFGWWNLTLQDELMRTRNELAPVVSSTSHIASLPPTAVAPPNALVRLHLASDSRSALLTAYGLKPLGPDQTYQLWWIRGGNATPANIFGVDSNGNSILTVQSDEPLGNFEQAGVTIEKAGGASTPNFNALVFAGPIKP